MPPPPAATSVVASIRTADETVDALPPLRSLPLSVAAAAAASTSHRRQPCAPGTGSIAAFVGATMKFAGKRSAMKSLWIAVALLACLASTVAGKWFLFAFFLLHRPSMGEEKNERYRERRTVEESARAGQSCPCPTCLKRNICMRHGRFFRLVQLNIPLTK